MDSDCPRGRRELRVGLVGDAIAQRGGKPVKLTVALEAAPDTGRDEIVLKGRSPFQGAKVANISPALADELRLDAGVEGVVITDLTDTATAANAASYWSSAFGKTVWV